MVQRLGIVWHDVSKRRPVYFATGTEQGVTLHEAVRASASTLSVPADFRFPSRRRAAVD
jgi:hypothetical protein